MYGPPRLRALSTAMFERYYTPYAFIGIASARLRKSSIHGSSIAILYYSLIAGVYYTHSFF